MKSKEQEANIEERRKKVAANLLAGLTYRQMAEVFNVALGTIAEDVKIIIGRWQREQVRDTDEFVQIELIRLDRAINAIWTKVEAGDPINIGLMLKIQERRAKYKGLDAPVKQHNFNFDFSQMTDEQLQRISVGEDPASVLASTTQSSG